jgi:hypothetical protein
MWFGEQNMDNKPQLVAGPFGRFIRKANGLIYYYKAEGLSIDKPTAIQFLEIIKRLDDSGCAKIIVIQGSNADYTFDGQQFLLTNNTLGGIAYVVETGPQLMAAEVMQNLARTLHSCYQVGAFHSVRDAEEWYLNNEMEPLVFCGCCPTVNDQAGLQES